MSKVLLKFKQKKRILISLLTLLFFTSFYAQSSFKICYGDKIDLGDVNKNLQFHISGPTGTIHLKGVEINKYTFSIPGNYSIKVEEEATDHKADCTEKHLPNTIRVAVSRIKMTFENAITFSSPLLKNKTTDGILLTVPVVVQTFDRLPVTLNNSIVKTSGIGTNITAKLQSEFKDLFEGKHLLHYTLSGMATENAYIMFDFIDANANTQSIALTTPIQN